MLCTADSTTVVQTLLMGGMHTCARKGNYIFMTREEYVDDPVLLNACS